MSENKNSLGLNANLVEQLSNNKTKFKTGISFGLVVGKEHSGVEELKRRVEKQFARLEDCHVRRIVVLDLNGGVEFVESLVGDTTINVKVIDVDWETDGKGAIYKASERLVEQSDRIIFFLTDADKTVHRCALNSLSNKKKYVVCSGVSK